MYLIKGVHFLIRLVSEVIENPLIIKFETKKGDPTVVKIIYITTKSKQKTITNLTFHFTYIGEIQGLNLYISLPELRIHSLEFINKKINCLFKKCISS